MSTDRITATKDEPGAASPDEWRPTIVTSERDSERAKFLADWDEPDDKPTAKGKPAANDDGDEDLDDDDDDDDDDEDEEVDEIEDAVEKPKKPGGKAKPAVEPVVDADDEPDPDDDSDLDEDEDPAKPADPVVAKGFAKLQKQEQRMRQGLERERATWQAEMARDREELKAERLAAAEAKTKFEKIVERARLDPMGALEELGSNDFEYAGKQAYLRTKGSTEPAYREAAAKMQRERELASKLSDVEKKLSDREKSETEQKQAAEQQRQVETYLGGVVKAAASVKKATLTQKLVASDPDFAKTRFAAAAHELWERDGTAPTHRAVVIAVEKSERALLRRYGIDPRSLAAAPPTKEVAAAVGKTGKGKKTRPSDDDLKIPTREELLKEEWR